MKDIKYPEVEVHLVGASGNAGSIMARVIRAMRKSGVSTEECNDFRMEATSGDYNHLLQTVMQWVSVS